MPQIENRIPFAVQRPFRPRKTAKTKIIFLSLEGSVTEEEYFRMISGLYSEISTKIQIISVAEDAAAVPPKRRTPDQVKKLSKNRPRQLVDRIDQFKKEEEETYQFSEYSDEFWIVTDVDNNWSDIEIRPGKTLREEWEEAIALCEEKGYGYAVSNPCFEIWLLLHHDTPTEEDKMYAVTEDHAYEKTDHFQERLRKLAVPLRGKGKDKKHITLSDYSAEKVELAVWRAGELHKNRQDLSPQYFATTVYLLLEKIMDMLPEKL